VQAPRAHRQLSAPNIRRVHTEFHPRDAHAGSRPRRARSLD
jgi:hypothetical protein